MTSRVINDPSALGWEYDPDTGRWVWGGLGSGSGGDGGGGGGDIEPGNSDGEILTWSTADAEWMPSDDMIVKGGNVGIGNDSPETTLDVSGTLRYGINGIDAPDADAASRPGFYAVQDLSTATNWPQEFGFINGPGTLETIAGYNQNNFSQIAFTQNAGRVAFRSKRAGNFKDWNEFVTADTDGDVYIRGNVGIGTDNPGDLLSLEKDSALGISLKRTGSSPSECLIENKQNRLCLSQNTNGIEFSTGTTPALAMAIRANGNVGIGMEPVTRTAKEQLAEWKASFDARLKAEPKADKKAVTLEITDDAFEVLPTEEALAEWMETRAVGDKFQVAGNISATGKANFQSQMNVSAAAIYRTNAGIDNGGNGLYFNGTGVLPAGPAGISDTTGAYELGSTQRQWKKIYGIDATFSGTVNAGYSEASVFRGGTTGESTPPFSFQGDTNTGMYRVAANRLGFSTNGAKRLEINATGDANFSGSVSADKQITTDYFLRTNSWRSKNQKSGLFLNDTSVIPLNYADDPSGISDGEISLGSTEAAFKDAHFSGTVSAGAFVGDGSGLTGLPSGGLTQAQGDARYVRKSGNSTVSGTITATDFVATSDERVKDNVTTAPRVIDQLHGREWEWSESGEKGSGVVAQELEQVLPHLVLTDDEGMKSVAYNGLVAYLIEEVKALRAEVEALKS